MGNEQSGGRNATTDVADKVLAGIVQNGSDISALSSEIETLSQKLDANTQTLQMMSAASQGGDALVRYEYVEQMRGFNCMQDVSQGGMVYCVTGQLKGSNLQPVPPDFSGVCQPNQAGDLFVCDVSAQALHEHDSLE